MPVKIRVFGQTAACVIAFCGAANAATYQWIVDTNRDGNPEIRRNYGLMTDIYTEGDFDGDGDLDLAAANDAENSVTILLNETL